MAKKLVMVGCGLFFSLAIDIAWADVVVVVSAHNPIETLSRTQLADIYLGRRNRFPNGGPVVPIDQREGSPTYEEFYSKHLRQSPAQIKAHWSRLIFTGRGQPPRSVSNGDAMAQIVAENPYAIGYLATRLVDDRLRVVPIE